MGVADYEPKCNHWAGEQNSTNVRQSHWQYHSSPRDVLDLVRQQEFPQQSPPESVQKHCKQSSSCSWTRSLSQSALSAWRCHSEAKRVAVCWKRPLMWVTKQLLQRGESRHTRRVTIQDGGFGPCFTISMVEIPCAPNNLHRLNCRFHMTIKLQVVLR